MYLTSLLPVPPLLSHANNNQSPDNGADKHHRLQEVFGDLHHLPEVHAAATAASVIAVVVDADVVVVVDGGGDGDRCW